MNLINPVTEAHLLLNNFETESDRKQLIVQQLKIANCLMNKLVIKLENILLKTMLENDQIELLKQAVRMSIVPFVNDHQQNLIVNAFGLQQTLDSVCDVNYIQTKPLKLYNKIGKKAKSLKEVKDKVFGSILSSFYFIGANLGLNYHEVQNILEKVILKLLYTYRYFGE
uniref:Uncharacterized protein n=1 Tax=Meloidogyne enterolobii TaxID=390850 RepID=A0A6V7V1A8_MELEN|nr:unnamed protein product [Meloidogyne enterolobii]